MVMIRKVTKPDTKNNTFFYNSSKMFTKINDLLILYLAMPNEEMHYLFLKFLQ